MYENGKRVVGYHRKMLHKARKKKRQKLLRECGLWELAHADKYWFEGYLSAGRKIRKRRTNRKVRKMRLRDIGLSRSFYRKCFQYWHNVF